MANRSFDEFLESDDELPSSYEDIPHIPAYLNDNRFDSSDDELEDDAGFENLHHETEREVPQKHSIDFNDEVLNSKVKPNASDVIEDVIKQDLNLRVEPKSNDVIKRGVLCKQDIFCIKSVANMVTENTALWLMDFLIQKDMQSKYTFLLSCLATGYLMEEFTVSKGSDDKIFDKQAFFLEIKSR